MSGPDRRLTVQPKGVLFDVDGTLLDTTSMIVLTMGEMYRRFLGIEVPAEDIRSIIGLPLDVQVRFFEDRTDVRPDYEEMKRFQIEQYERHKHLEHPVPEALQAVRECAARGIKTGLVTSKDAMEMSNTLRRMNLDGALGVVITSSDCVKPKPNPEPVLRALDALFLNPEEAVYIGDTDYDVQAARGAGCSAAVVLWGAQNAERLLAANPDGVFRTPEELLAWSRSLKPG